MHNQKIFGAALFLIASAEAAASPPAKITVDVSGSYRVDFADPAWSFGGNTGAKLKDIHANDSSDAIGTYHEVIFSESVDTARSYSIRAYRDRPVVMFTDKSLAARGNAAPFPTLNAYPGLSHHLSFEGNFAKYNFSQLAEDSPWVFFDDMARTFILSPATEYMVAQSRVNPNGALAFGIDSNIKNFPAGFAHQTILVAQAGINRAFDVWGHAITDLNGKHRPPNDTGPMLKSLGYWTDRGATYYYHYDADKGYRGTLLAVQDEFKRAGLTMGYLELDSWWYPKGFFQRWDLAGLFDGIYSYTAAAQLFPAGLKGFQAEAGTPFVTHARWIDPQSPYRKQYLFSGNVSVDPKLWRQMMDYIHQGGVTTYLQDWLSGDTHSAEDLVTPNAFMDQMAQAANDDGISLLYCSELPKHLMQGAKYDNLTSVRLTTDRFADSKWEQFLFGSRFASALGEWPWSDVVMSDETEDLLLANLSGGVVGIGDPLGHLDTDNVLRVSLPNSVLVKPDVPLVPLDESYIVRANGGKQALVSSTYSEHGSGIRTNYVFAFNPNASSAIPVHVNLSSIGVSGPAYVYDYFHNNGKLVTGAFDGSADGKGYYYVVAPLLKSGIAFLGDTHLFVSNGHQRLIELRDGSDATQATLAFAATETKLTLQGYAPAKPVVQTTEGAVRAVTYDTNTRLFTVVVTPSAGSRAVVRLSAH